MSKIERLPKTFSQFIAEVKLDPVYTQDQVDTAESTVGRDAPGYIKNIALSTNEFPKRRLVANLFQHSERK